MKNASYFIALLLIISCSSNREQQLEKWKQEVMETEQAFAKMAKIDGIPKAFEVFAAPDAVLMRNNELIIGKQSIVDLYNERPSSNVKLEWKPEFIEVAASGDLAYTYGYFTYSAIDSTGKTNSSKGVFHTVWKRQEDGSWKYVWD